MKKIMISIGTRPEAIKLLPLVSLLRDAAQLYVLFTGQHKEIAEDVFSLFSERFDRNLSVMGEGKSLSTFFGYPSWGIGVHRGDITEHLRSTGGHRVGLFGGICGIPFKNKNSAR